MSSQSLPLQVHVTCFCFIIRSWKTKARKWLGAPTNYTKEKFRRTVEVSKAKQILLEGNMLAFTSRLKDVVKNAISTVVDPESPDAPNARSYSALSAKKSKAGKDAAGVKGSSTTCVIDEYLPYSSGEEDDDDENVPKYTPLSSIYLAPSPDSLWPQHGDSACTLEPYPSTFRHVFLEHHEKFSAAAIAQGDKAIEKKRKRVEVAAAAAGAGLAESYSSYPVVSHQAPIAEKVILPPPALVSVPSKAVGLFSVPIVTGPDVVTQPPARVISTAESEAAAMAAMVMALEYDKNDSASGQVGVEVAPVSMKEQSTVPIPPPATAATIDATGVANTKADEDISPTVKKMRTESQLLSTAVVDTVLKAAASARGGSLGTSKFVPAVLSSASSDEMKTVGPEEVSLQAPTVISAESDVNQEVE